MPAALARSANRITLTRALVALGFVLVGINVASAIWDVRTDRDRTDLRARRDLSNLSGLLAEQTAAALEAVDLVLRDAVREGTAAKVRDASSLSRTATRPPAGFSSARPTRAEPRARNGASSCRGASTRPAARSAASLRR